MTQTTSMTKRPLWPHIRRLLMRHVDGVLLAGLGAMLLVGMVVLFSAADGNWARMQGQIINIVAGLVCMWLVANMPLHYLMRVAVPIYALGMVLLLGVALFGDAS
ncbi:MAG: rod shape-determining protein RodA, partial [Gallionellaceae bacterium]|nr:rod shape-determining protein RodA [Gallionellaceae bacterium]